jgi:hypothetical protein
MSKTRAERIIKNYTDTSRVEPLPCRGRPQALNDRDIRNLLRM